jgi:hypothetical protein
MSVQAADAVVIASNDNAHQVCSRMLHMKSVTLFDINKVCLALHSHSYPSSLQSHLKVLARDLAAVLQNAFQDLECKVGLESDKELLFSLHAPLFVD